MVPEGSLLRSKEHSTGPYSEHINPVHTTPSYLPKIHLNIILHLRLGLPGGLLPSGFPTKPLICIPLLPSTINHIESMRKIKLMQTSLKIPRDIPVIRIYV
jgi:hypothetical protein